MISLYGCFKNTFIFDVRTWIHDAVHHHERYEFHLYFSKIRFEKKFTVHNYNVYISFTESITEVHILGYTEVDILCALSLHAVVLRAVEVRDCHEELTGREVLINAAVPCILKA